MFLLSCDSTVNHQNDTTTGLIKEEVHSLAEAQHRDVSSSEEEELVVGSGWFVSL